MMSAVEPCFQIAKCAMDVQHCRFLLWLMKIALHRRLRVTAPPICGDYRSFVDIALHELADRNLVCPFRRGEPQPTGFLFRAPLTILIDFHFDCTEDQSIRFFLADATPSFALHWTANDCFIGFHPPSKQCAGVVDHGSAQTVEHVPSRPVSRDSQLSLQLQCAHPRRMRRNQVGRPEPVSQRKM